MTAMMRSPVVLVLLSISTVGLGCRQTLIDSTDREVYRVIQDRQRAALGSTTDVHLGAETGDIGPTPGMYDFVPRSVDSELPETFTARVSGDCGRTSRTSRRGGGRDRSRSRR